MQYLSDAVAGKQTKGFMKWQACLACSYRFSFEVIVKFMERRNRAAYSGAKRNGMCSVMYEWNK